MYKVGQSGGFLGRLSGPLVKIGLPLMKDMLKPLAKSVLITVGLTAAASVTDVPIFKKMFGSGMSTSMISNKEMNGITRIV